VEDAERPHELPEVDHPVLLEVEQVENLHATRANRVRERERRGIWRRWALTLSAKRLAFLLLLKSAKWNSSLWMRPSLKMEKLIFRYSSCSASTSSTETAEAKKRARQPSQEEEEEEEEGDLVGLFLQEVSDASTAGSSYPLPNCLDDAHPMDGSRVGSGGLGTERCRSKRFGPIRRVARDNLFTDAEKQLELRTLPLV
jgi:hypothetical protein